jgi:hypothetical protein
MMARISPPEIGNSDSSLLPHDPPFARVIKINSDCWIPARTSWQQLSLH